VDKRALHVGIMGKQLLPEAVAARRPFLFFGDRRLAFWALAAVGSALAARWYRHETPVRTEPWRLAISLVPLIPAYLNARRLIRWISGLDEMQLRIQQQALVFAAMWTVFLRMALDLVAASGYLNDPLLGQGLGVEGTFAAMCVLYMAGCVVANRRFQ
jgi:hypothetical protein